jgi:hypothetical protein
LIRSRRSCFLVPGPESPPADVQALAAEMVNYSKAAFDDAMRTCEQLIGVKSLEQAVEIQSQYAKRVYDNHIAELSKLGEMCVSMARDASKPIQETSKRFTQS